MRPSYRFGLVLLLALAGSSAVVQILNSERIEQTFGSYGIDVVFSDEELRISNLYSLHAGRKVTRTLAFVGYPESIDPAIAGLHQTIVAGGSIGATFQAAGWEVVKTGHSYFRVGLPPAVVEAMDIDGPGPVAAHYYQLEVANGPERFDYALIIEMHHPDYLDEPALAAIYGPEQVVGMLESARLLFTRGMQRFTDAGLTLSQ